MFQCHKTVKCIYIRCTLVKFVWQTQQLHIKVFDFLEELFSSKFSECDFGGLSISTSIK